MKIDVHDITPSRNNGIYACVENYKVLIIRLKSIFYRLILVRFYFCSLTLKFFILPLYIWVVFKKVIMSKSVIKIPLNANLNTQVSIFYYYLI